MSGGILLKKEDWLGSKPRFPGSYLADRTIRVGACDVFSKVLEYVENSSVTKGPCPKCFSEKMAVVRGPAAVLYSLRR